MRKMKMYIVAEVNDVEFDTENQGYVYTTPEGAQDAKEKLEAANPDTKYTIWEID